MSKINLPIKSKLPQTETSIFAVMSGLAQKHEALNLSQGFPDFPSDPKLTTLVSTYMKKGFNQYAPMPGILPLREALSQKIKDSYNRRIDPKTEITITSGATQAIFSAISCVVNQDDEVIVLEPCYDCYIPTIILNGGQPIPIPLNPDYSVNWGLVKNRISSRTKMIIINSPHNPTGSTLTRSDMLELEKLTDNTDIIILSDEVYEHIIFDKKKHESVLKYPKLLSRSFAVFSFGKTFHNTGWKMGYCVGPENLMHEFRKIHQFVVFSSNTPIQYALTDYLADGNVYDTLPEFYGAKRDLFLESIKDSRFTPIHCQGTYFQLLKYNDISKLGDRAFAEELTEKHKIASIPISAFYRDKTDNHVLRFCFAKNEKTIGQAGKILSRI